MQTFFNARRLLRCARVAMGMCLGAAAPAAAQESTPTKCPGDTSPPCALEWTVPSRFVDPERALVSSGKLNGTDGEVDPGGGVRRPSHQLKARVHLPAGYDGERRFPVLYLLHGSGGTYEVWLRAHDAGPLLAELPAVVVMPEGGTNGFFANWWKGGRDAAPQLAWERYHLDELMPLVEERLKIRPGRRWHAIFGFSMGANGAVRYAAQCGGCFGTAGSLSGALDLQDPSFALNCGGGNVVDTAWFGRRGAEDHWCLDTFGDPVANAFYWEAHNPIRLTANLRHVRVYVSHGNGVEDELEKLDPCVFCEAQFAMMGARFVARAREDGVPVEHHARTGGHSPIRATADLEDAVSRWGIFERVDDDPHEWVFQTASQHGRMWGLDYEFEHPPAQLVVFERQGRVLSGAGSGRVSIRPRGGDVFTVTLPFRVSLPTGRALDP